LLTWDALRSLPAHLQAEHHEKWERLQALKRKPHIGDRFEAGKHFGEMTGELILTIGGLLDLAVVSIEIAARAPSLVRVARGVLKNAGDDVARVPRLAPIEAEAVKAPRTPETAEASSAKRDELVVEKPLALEGVTARERVLAAEPGAMPDNMPACLSWRRRTTRTGSTSPSRCA
jgi:hypothetical protein